MLAPERPVIHTIPHCGPTAKRAKDVDNQLQKGRFRSTRCEPSRQHSHRLPRGVEHQPSPSVRPGYRLCGTIQGYDRPCTEPSTVFGELAPHGNKLHRRRSDLLSNPSQQHRSSPSQRRLTREYQQVLGIRTQTKLSTLTAGCSIWPSLSANYRNDATNLDLDSDLGVKINRVSIARRIWGIFCEVSEKCICKTSIERDIFR